MASSLGGAGIAGMDGAESALLNPALVPVFKNSSIGAYYRDGMRAHGEHRWAVGLGAIDTGEDVWFPGALHYVRLRATGLAPYPANGELWHGAAGQRFGERLSMGLSVYRLSEEVNHDTFIQWNGSIGLLFMINSHLGVAYVANNLAKPGSNVPLALRQNFQQVAGIFAGLGEVARVRLDLARQESYNPDHKLAIRLGLEAKTSNLFVVRLGYSFDDLKGERIWTGGLGFDGPRLRFNYAFAKNQVGTSGVLHSVDLSLPF